jgi:hypothetical protein
MALFRFRPFQWAVLLVSALALLVIGTQLDGAGRYISGKIRSVVAPSAASTAYYNSRRDLFAISGVRHSPLVMLGDSHIDLARWYELLGCSVANHGIGGDTTAGVLARIDDVIALQPKHVVIMVGVNDVLRGIPPSRSAINIERMIVRIQSAGAKPIVSYVTPTSSTFRGRGVNQSIDELNDAIEQMLSRHPDVDVIDLRPDVTVNGALKAHLHYDGIHWTAPVYAMIRDRLLKLTNCRVP